jgi:hypothetical protein
VLRSSFIIIYRFLADVLESNNYKPPFSSLKLPGKHLGFVFDGTFRKRSIRTEADKMHKLKIYSTVDLCSVG